MRLNFFQTRTEPDGRGLCSAEFDAIEFFRVMRGSDHESGRKILERDRVVKRRGWHAADLSYIYSLFVEAADHLARQKRRRAAHVHAHHHFQRQSSARGGWRIFEVCLEVFGKRPTNPVSVLESKLTRIHPADVISVKNVVLIHSHSIIAKSKLFLYNLCMRDKFLPQFNEPPALNSESERTKEVEQVIDRRLEEMLVRHTELVNQGVNGFIFKMEMTGIQPGVIEQLKTAGLNLETNPDK